MAQSISVHLDQHDMPQALHDVLGAYSRLFMFQGAILTILGIAAIIYPALAFVALEADGKPAAENRNQAATVVLTLVR